MTDNSNSFLEMFRNFKKAGSFGVLSVIFGVPTFIAGSEIAKKQELNRERIIKLETRRENIKENMDRLYLKLERIEENQTVILEKLK